MDLEERYAFLAEYYDPNACLIRKYQLLFYVKDETCEMYDIKNKRLFLRRTKVPELKMADLFLGSIVSVHSRQLTIKDFGDEFTRRKLRAKTEKTLAIIKPDCIHKLGEILEVIAREQFIICGAKMLRLSRKQAEEFYNEHAGKPFFDNLVSFMTEGPIVVIEMKGDNAVQVWREMIGPTNSAQARRDAPSSIRAQFGTDNTRNACHGSDSVESATREIEFFFGKQRFDNTTKLKGSTLGIIKPHAVLSGSVGPIITDILSNGLKITALQLHYVDRANAAEFYEVYKGVVAEYTDMVTQLCSGPCIAIEVHSDDDAHGKFRKLCGPADPELAKYLRPNTLRAKYGKDKIQNALHCTDLPDDSILEVEYFFKILDS